MKNKTINLYYFAIFIIFFITLSGWSTIINIGNIYYLLIILAMVLLALHFFSNKYSYKQLLIILLLFIVLTYTSIKINNIVFILNFLLIISAKNIDFKKVVKIDIMVRSFYLIVHFCMEDYKLHFVLK